MRCVYEIRLTRWSYDKSPRSCVCVLILSFHAQIPCALNKGDEIDGLPGMDAAIVSKCIWSHKDGLLAVKLEDEEFEFDGVLRTVVKRLVMSGWTILADSEQLDSKYPLPQSK